MTASAYGEGALSGGQLQAIVANLSDDTTPLFKEAEAELVPRLARLGARDVAQVMQAWAAAARDRLQPDPGDGDPDEDPGPERRLHLCETMDGRGELSGSLDPEARSIAETALRLADRPDGDADPERTPARRRADALVDILRFFLDHQASHPAGRHRPHLNVIVDYEDLIGQHDGRHGTGSRDRAAHADPCPRAPSARHATSPGPDVNPDQAAPSASMPGGPRPSRQPAGGPASGRTGGGRLVDGTVLDAATIRRLACDAGIHRVVMAGRSSVLDYGWTTRTIPANLWAALVTRDRCCRFPGCDRPPQWPEGHHVVPWEHGGRTALANLALLCSRHHHVVHGPGWTAAVEDDGTLHVTDPKGRVHTTHPPGRLHNLFTPSTHRWPREDAA